MITENDYKNNICINCYENCELNKIKENAKCKFDKNTKTTIYFCENYTKKGN